VDSNSLDKLALDLRKGREEIEEAGDPRCLGSVIEACRSAG
jgi:hypothetical protein